MTLPRLLVLAAACIAPLAAIGCGKPAMVAVKCKVMHDGKPVDNCKVAFVQDVEPFDAKVHGYGYGNTDANGECEIAHPMTGEKGLFPGTYKVTFEAWKNKRGKSVPPTEKPSEVEGGVSDRLPPILKSIGSTTERFTVPKGAAVDHTFTIAGK